MATATKRTGSRDGIEWRTDARGRRAYRWVINSKAGKQQGDWGPSHAEAKSGRAKAQTELATGAGARPSALTLRDYWTAFIQEAKAGTATSRWREPFKPSTLRGYERGWAKVDPELGAHRLTDIRKRDIQAMLDRWAVGGIAPSTIRNALDPLRTLYRRALARDLVPVDPTKGLDVPADRRDAPMRFASREEAERLIAAVPDGDRAVWATAMYAGLRRGELRALRWGDVDLSGGLITVARSWDDSEGEQTPKTAGSRRKVPIVPALATPLGDHRKATGRSGSDLVFGRTAAQPFIPTTIRSRALAAWATAQAAPITLHQCRHTFASLMIAAGCNAKALSVVMGHASITITFDTYGKLMPGGEVEVGRLLGTYLSSAV